MKLTQKLKSTTGASLIIALVFMMFCTFVGGAVLAASTANAGRIKALKADEQAYLDQRSAAQLIINELMPDKNTSMNLDFSVNEDAVTKRFVILTGTGGLVETGEVDKSNAVTIETSKPVLTTPMQRILFEWAILSFVKQNNIDLDIYPEDGVFFTYSPADKSSQEVKTVEDFWLYSKFIENIEDFECSMEISLAKGGSAFGNKLTAQFSCSYEDGNPRLVITLGEDPVVSVVMNGIATMRKQSFTDPPTQDGNDQYVTSYETIVTTLSWGAPAIEKGTGA